MLNLLRKKQLAVAASNARVSNFGCVPKFLSLPQSATSVIRTFCESANNVSDQQQSLTLSYLINSCGLSPAAAVAASKKLVLKSPEKADSVLSLLKSHGYIDAHITKLITKAPNILLANPEKTILPKLRFLQSIGVAAPVLAQVTCTNPFILAASLDKAIVPLCNYLKSLLQSDKKVIQVFKNSRAFYIPTALRRIPVNVDILKKHQVSDSNISLLVVHYPRTLLMKSDDLTKVVKMVPELGIDISKSMSVLAVNVLCGLSKAAWEHKREMFRMWGWSNSDIAMAFSLQPLCMNLSEKKATSTMEFLVNQMNWEPRDIARHPSILLYSLDKRIAPRCRVVQLLMMTGLIQKSCGLHRLVSISEKNFRERFIKKYEHVPRLLDIYGGKFNLLDLGFSSSELAEVKLL